MAVAPPGFGAFAGDLVAADELSGKLYGIAPDGTSLVGIYLWVNKAAADAFYTADWVAMVTKRWAGPPQRQEWETPMVVESAERRLVAAE